MSLTSGELSAADVAAVVGNNGGGGYGSGNNGWGGDGAWWLLVLFLFAFNGNWGNNGNSNGGGNGGFYGYGAPYVVNDVQRGFDQSAVMTGLGGIQSGIQGLSTQLCNCCSDIQGSLCNGFAGVNGAISNGFAQAEIANNARQIADMQQAFAAQTAMSQGFNQLGSQFADCCCENRLASADLKYTIATENCADRTAIADGIRDVIDASNRNYQGVIDKLCQLELDAKNDKISDLERQLTMANLAASQTAQTGRILADNAAQTMALEQYLNPAPIPAYVVQNPNCCAQNPGCGCNTGCGCGSF